MLLTILSIIFLVSILLGVPLVYSLLIATLGTISVAELGYSDGVVFHAFISGIEKAHLLAIPLFIAAGAVLSRGGVGARMIDFAASLFGWLPGGLAVVTVVSSMLFGAVSGSAIAGAAAIGSVMIPGMEKRGYPKAYSAALVAVSGTLGVIIPPSIPMLVYGFVANVSIKDLFLAGVMPGVLFGTGLIGLCIWQGKTRGFEADTKAFSFAEVRRTFVRCIPSLLMPTVILGGIWSGVFTPTEAAAVATVYGILVSVVVQRELKWSQLPSLFLDAFATNAVVMLVIASTASLSWLVTAEQVPQEMAAFVQEFAGGPIMFLLLLNLILVIVGVFLEPLPALLLTAPLFMPAAAAFGIDPVQFGLIIVCNLAFGLFTPPVGGTLFVSARMARVGMGAISLQMIPFFIVSGIVLILITYVPAISLWLVELLQ
ncbi:TRAP transporter large permease [Pelagicoccus mobilis]|uniref:TRAP transporter large permease n=1 Tax=Pelagicoccus mobilis TaxID=415221 RepID=A0A934VSC2_9BACT|nr:TRAP transporter large permease [Pelagicoccus mobilis]MBK1880282.1 TRAP transporter large permease [Pelagicoccus mobilis]